MKLVAAVERPEEAAWLEAFAFAPAGITTVVVSGGDGGVDPALPDARAIPTEVHPAAPGRMLPDFATIVRTLEDERPDGCLLLSGGVLARLVNVAADLLGISVFALVTTPEELANCGQRAKRRPDLFFLADARLFPAALSDPRYGSTMLPAGHPGRDLQLTNGGASDQRFADARLGDGQAAARMLEAIGRWQRDALDPATPELSIVVPAYKEEKNLPMVCDRLLDALTADPTAAEILLVDDSSPDGTYAVALAQMWRSPRIRALSKPTPHGMGNGIRYGLQRARAQVVAVTMGDGSDEVARIPDMFRKIRDEGYALAIGSRYRDRKNYANVPRLYRFWSACFRFTTRVLIGVSLSDYTNAFRVFDRRIFARYGAESGGFEISPEITFKAWFQTKRVTEVDVCHLKRSFGQSSFSFLRAGPGYARILIKAFVNRLTGRWFTLFW